MQSPKTILSGETGKQRRLLVFAICFMVLAGSNLVFPRESAAFDALAWTAAIALAGGILALAFPHSARLYLLFAVLCLLVAGAGWLESACVLLWLASAWSLGTLALEGLRAKENFSVSCTAQTLLTGAALWLAIWGVMLHFSINFQWLHISFCLLACLPLAHRISDIRSEFLCSMTAAQDWMRSIPFWAWTAGLAVAGWVLRWTSFPSLGYDDHALHLRMWTELLTQQRYSFDVSAQIWAVAPFAVDLLHAGLSLIAGDDARSAMNLALAIFLLLLMAKILHFWNLPARTQWLLMVLMASTPMLGNLLLGLQTELALAVLALAGMYLITSDGKKGRGSHAPGVLACAALCAGVKLPGAVLGAMLLAAWAVCCWRQRETKAPVNPVLRWPGLLLFIPFGFVALHSYAMAWKLTGNPVFPLYNAVFLSPFYTPVNFSDTRWIHGFGLSNYVRAFFHTSDFFEAGDYAAGWQYLVMLPIAILALLRPGIPGRMRIILAPLLGFGLAMFYATQYWRYLFPVIPLAAVTIGSLFIQRGAVWRNTAFILAFACIVANLSFFTQISWMMNAPAALAFTRAGKKELASKYAPASLLTQKVNELAPGARVLYAPNIPYGATLHGSPIYLNWYQTAHEKASGLWKNPGDIEKFIADEQIDFVILRMSPSADLRNILLREHMSRYGYAETQVNNTLLYRVSDAPIEYRKIFDLQAPEENAPEHAGLLISATRQKEVTATTEGQILAVMPTFRARQARYKTEFICPSKNGYFVAQINWNQGAPYYRLVACKAEVVSFAEAIPIPVSASQGTLYVTSRETPSIQVRNITVEVN